jgi:hypothetical protein
MSSLDHNAISKVLGSTMKPVQGVRFGHFGTLAGTAEAMKALQHGDSGLAPAAFSLKDDRLLARAFEKVRKGASADALLWDTDLAQRFVERCRELGLAFPAAALVHRVLYVRKHLKTYGKHGITLSPATRTEPQPSIAPQYAHVIEFALVRLRYRYGADIDTILAEPGLREQFEGLALQAAPDLTGEQLRLGALYIRKARQVRKGEVARARGLKPAVVEGAMTPPVSLAHVSPDAVPSAPGLLELRESERYLYAARNDNLRSAVEQLRTGRPFSVLADNFWKPALEAITVRYVAGREVGGVSTSRWEARLLDARAPVFNWPIPGKGEAAQGQTSRPRPGGLFRSLED